MAKIDRNSKRFQILNKIHAYCEFLLDNGLDAKYKKIDGQVTFRITEQEAAAVLLEIERQRKICCATYDRAMALAQQLGVYNDGKDMRFEEDGLAIIKHCEQRLKAGR